MGHKVNPTGIRLGIGGIFKAKAIWIPEGGKSFATILRGDLLARAHILKRMPEAAGVTEPVFERTGRTMRVLLRAAKPGVLIGKKGEDIEKLKAELTALMGVPVHINIEEVRKPELEALLVARGIAQQLERRVMFRRAMKRAVQSAMRVGAKGIKVCVSGRLGGAEIARSEMYREGRVPLHKFRANIDYATATAKTTYGIIGVKVWIFKGEVIEKTEAAVSQQEAV
jgi:small subunit ribosomal protein S3